MKFVYLVLFLIPLSACSVKSNGKDVVTQQGGNSESYSYDFTENNCPTGAHTFSSKDAYCDGLKNDALNKYCASTLRYGAFKADCAGRSWQ